MKKKYFWSLLTFMIVAMLSVGLVSCGGDDDDDNGNVNGDELVTKLQGKWEFYGGKETVIGTTITMDKSTLNEIKSMMSSATGQRVYFWDETLNFNGYQVNGIKYSLKGSQLIMDGMDLMEGFTITIKTINSTTLVLHEVISMEGIDIVADIEYHKETTNNTENNNNPEENTETGNNTESSEYIATEQIKTITLKTSSNQEYMIYKDFYWKHKLYIEGTNICFNSYYGGGNGWTLNNGGYSLGENHVGIRDRGEIANINGINDKTIRYSSWVTSEKLFNINGGSSYGQFFGRSVSFKPNHGYEVAFIIGTNNEIMHMRMFPTKYTLDSNDMLTSVTLEYQLY